MTVQKVDALFAPWFERLSSWKEKIVQGRLEAEEITALLCIYLDSLASHFLWPLGMGFESKRRFLFLLRRFTAFAEKWDLISLPDLHADLLWAKGWSWGLFYSQIHINIPPNRELYKLLKPFLQTPDLYDNVIQTMIELITLEMERGDELLKNLDEFDATLHESLNKALHVNIERETLCNFLRCFSLGEIFYREYRCAAVHELMPVRTPAMWKEETPYVTCFEGDPLVYGEGIILRKVVFPLRFIWNTAWDATQRIQSEFKSYVLANQCVLDDELDIDGAIHRWLETFDL